jgi:hypothetical protein
MNSAVQTDTYLAPAAEFEDDGVYRSVSKAAITSVALAVLGIAGFWAPLFVVLPVLAICFGVIGLSNIRKFPGELVGTGAAWIGIVAGSLILVGSVSFITYVYMTEVPEGYTRVTFYDLKPSSRSSRLFTERAEELDGQKIFIKGYVRPGNQSRGLKKFVLTGDFGDCCFGGNPKITEIIGVTITGAQTVDYDLRYRKILGTFRLNKSPKVINEKDVPSIIYEIEASEVR